MCLTENCVAIETSGPLMVLSAAGRSGTFTANGTDPADAVDVEDECVRFFGKVGIGETAESLLLGSGSGPPGAMYSTL